MRASLADTQHSCAHSGGGVSPAREYKKDNEDERRRMHTGAGSAPTRDCSSGSESIAFDVFGSPSLGPSAAAAGAWDAMHLSVCGTVSSAVIGWIAITGSQSSTTPESKRPTQVWRASSVSVRDGAMESSRGSAERTAINLLALLPVDPTLLDSHEMRVRRRGVAHAFAATA